MNLALLANNMKQLKRYVRIYQAILRINIAAVMAYRANFINNVFTSFAWGVFNFVWIILLTNKSTQVFGWKRDELVFITIGYVLLTGLYYAFFGRNFELFSRIIDRGEFDGILLKPIDSQFHISTLRVGVASLIRAIMGTGILMWWIAIHHYSVGPFQIVSFIVLLAVGVMLLYTIWFLFISLLIWYPNLSNLVEILYTINGFARYPSEMIKNIGSLPLLIFLPLALIVSTPVKALLQKNAWGDIFLLVGIFVVLFSFSRVWWKRALRSYTSAS